MPNNNIGQPFRSAKDVTLDVENKTAYLNPEPKTVANTSSISSKYDDAIKIIDDNCKVDELRYFKEDTTGSGKVLEVNTDNPIHQILSNTITLSGAHKENQIRYEYVQIMKALGINNINEDNSFCKMMLVIEPNGELAKRRLYISHLKKLYNSYLDYSINNQIKKLDIKTVEGKYALRKLMTNILLGNEATTTASQRDKFDKVANIVRNALDKNDPKEYLPTLKAVNKIINGNSN